MTRKERIEAAKKEFATITEYTWSAAIEAIMFDYRLSYQDAKKVVEKRI